MFDLQVCVWLIGYLVLFSLLSYPHNPFFPRLLSVYFGPFSTYPCPMSLNCYLTSGLNCFLAKAFGHQSHDKVQMRLVKCVLINDWWFFTGHKEDASPEKRSCEDRADTVICKSRVPTLSRISSADNWVSEFPECAK